MGETEVNSYDMKIKSNNSQFWAKLQITHKTNTLKHVSARQLIDPHRKCACNQNRALAK